MAYARKCDPKTWVDRIDYAIIDGLMLGDATIAKGSPYFMFAQSREHKASFPMGIRRMLIDSGMPCNFHQGIPKSDGVLITTIWTPVTDSWERERERWYPEGKKIIPDDFRVTPASMLMYHLCDGCLSHQRIKSDGTKSGAHVVLSTYAYTVEDLVKLAAKINEAAGLSGRFTMSKNHTLHLCYQPAVRSYMNYMLKGGSVPSGYEYKFRGFLPWQHNLMMALRENSLPVNYDD